MNTRPNKVQTKETATDAQDATTVASIKLENVTGGWWYGPGPGAYAGWGGPWGGAPGPYGNPYAAARYASYERRAAWYAANAPGYRPWWY